MNEPLIESSSSIQQDDIPAPEFQNKFTTKTEISCCQQPDYKNINGKVLIIICFLMVLSQSQLYYAVDVEYSKFSSSSQKQIYNIIGQVVKVFSATLLNTVFRNLSDLELLFYASVACFISSAVAVASVSFIAIECNSLSYIYIGISTVCSNSAMSMQFIGGLCYMIKCMQQKNSNGIIIGIFLVCTILGTNVLDNFQNFIPIQWIQLSLWVSQVLSLIQLFIISKMPIPSFYQKEIDIRDVYQNLISSQNRTQYKFKNYTVIESRQDKKIVQNDKLMKDSEIFIGFYTYVLFKTTSGALLFLECSLFIFFQSVMNQVMNSSNNPFTHPNCYTGKQQYLTDECYSDIFIFEKAGPIMEAGQIIVFLLLGYLYDFFLMRSSSKEKLQLQIFQVFAVLATFAMGTTGIINSELYWYRDIFIITTLVVFAMNIVIIHLNIITLFSGGYRVAVCFVFTFLYFFNTISYFFTVEIPPYCSLLVITPINGVCIWLQQINVQ